MKLIESTPFSEFIRNATPAEKEVVYAKVLDASTVRQLTDIRRAEAEKLKRDHGLHNIVIL